MKLFKVPITILQMRSHEPCVVIDCLLNHIESVRTLLYMSHMFGEAYGEVDAYLVHETNFFVNPAVAFARFFLTSSC